ncbi:PREDICTED: uncharacterized protein LOC106109086 [Papilio polytes]|uniref:uncharacterized protein LOC106109086 n=1 Tax=Papilio polytes TaxID=76194 RepID=UPI0006766E97|nr:PREDICTED: uncharacterized protein LOC106109086 [Papilio polytes]
MFLRKVWRRRGGVLARQLRRRLARARRLRALLRRRAAALAAPHRAARTPDGRRADDAAHAGAHARPARAAHASTALRAAAQALHTGTAHNHRLVDESWIRSLKS